MKLALPPRPRHQIKRSITEHPPAGRKHHHLHPHHRRKDRGERAPLSAAPSLQKLRGSVELPRSEAVTPSQMSQDGSRRTSMLRPSAERAAVLAATAGAAEEQQARTDREKAALQTECVRPYRSRVPPSILFYLFSRFCMIDEGDPGAFSSLSSIYARSSTPPLDGSTRRTTRCWKSSAFYRVL